MRRKTCRISVFIALVFLLIKTVPAQYAYRDETADFTVSESDGNYEVFCLLKVEINHSRKLQRAFNQLRLKAIDLIGNYIVLNSLEMPLEDRGAIFQAFIDNTAMRFTADVEKIKATPWGFCDQQRCITFECAKSDFRINERYLEQEFDFSNILYMNFRRNKTIGAACALLTNVKAGTELLIPTEMQFLNGSAAIGPMISQLLEINRSYRLENSLFGQDGLQQAYVDSVSLMQFDCCPFGKMIISKILFTSAAPDYKQAYYDDYRYYLSQLEDEWYDMVRFAAAGRNEEEITPIEEATVFDMIGSWPVALNPFAMRQGSNGQYYDQATQAFAEEDIDKALELLQSEINFNGITAGNLNLAGACFRLLNKPARALAYLLMAFYLDRDIPYVRGNIVLCLDALEYPRLQVIATGFAENKIIDPWSENQIMNLLKK